MGINSKAQAIAQKMWIMHTMERLSSADPDTGDYYESAQAIQEDPLSVQVRTGWFTVGEPQPPRRGVLYPLGNRRSSCPHPRLSGGIYGA